MSTLRIQRGAVARRGASQRFALPYIPISNSDSGLMKGLVDLSGTRALGPPHFFKGVECTSTR